MKESYKSVNIRVPQQRTNKATDIGDSLQYGAVSVHLRWGGYASSVNCPIDLSGYFTVSLLRGFKPAKKSELAILIFT